MCTSDPWPETESSVQKHNGCMSDLSEARIQARVFEVFNAKVKLLHDSFSYQTIQLLLFILTKANAISSLSNYRKGAAKKNKKWSLSPLRWENKTKEIKTFFFHIFLFFTQVQIWTVSMPLSVTVSSSLFYSVVSYVQGEDNGRRGTASTRCPPEMSVLKTKTSLLVGDIPKNGCCSFPLFVSQSTKRYSSLNVQYKKNPDAPKQIHVQSWSL